MILRFLKGMRGMRAETYTVNSNSKLGAHCLICK